MSISDHKRKVAKRLKLAKQAIERSPEIPRELKSFLLVFLGHTSPACDYEALWPSQTLLGKELGYAIDVKYDTCRTIKRHISLLRKLGAVEIKTMGNAAAESHFLMRYEYRLKSCRSKFKNQHRLNYYFIKWGHPLWQGRLDTGMLDDHRKANRGETKKDSSKSNRDSGGRFQKQTLGSKSRISKPGHTCPDRTRSPDIRLPSEVQMSAVRLPSEPGHVCPDRTGSPVTRKFFKKETAPTSDGPIPLLPCPPPALSGIDSPDDSTQELFLASKASPGRDLARPHLGSCFAELLPTVTTLIESETLGDELSPEEMESLEEFSGDELSPDEIGLLEEVQDGVLASEYKAAAAAASLFRNPISRTQDGSPASLLSHEFERNGVPRIESVKMKAPWLCYQRPELRRLELAGRSRGL